MGLYKLKFIQTDRSIGRGPDTQRESPKVRGIAGHIEQAERGAIRKSPQALLPTSTHSSGFCIIRVDFFGFGFVLAQVQVQVQFGSIITHGKNDRLWWHQFRDTRSFHIGLNWEMESLWFCSEEVEEHRDGTLKNIT